MHPAHKRLSSLLKFCSLVLSIGFPRSTLASASGLPVIVSHANENLAIYQSDSVTLDISATGEGLSYSWTRNGTEECTEAKCVFQTSTWSVGVHLITVTVSNELGLRSFRYTIHVLSRPGGVPVKNVYPGQTTDPREDDFLERDDFLVSASKGMGFKATSAKTEPIDFHPQRLQWNEKLRTNFEGLLEFGRKRSDRHFLLKESTGLLATTDAGKRLIVLQKGILRSRNFANAAPNWSITVGSWLQVDTDSLGDVVVDASTENGDVASITLLRGHGRVTMRLPTEAAPGTTAEISMIQGTSLTIHKGDHSLPTLRKPKSDAVAKVIGETTPEFILLGEAEASEGSEGNVANRTNLLDNTDDADPPIKVSLSAAKSEAKRFLTNHDYFSALTALAAFESEAVKDFDLARLLGEASKGVFLYEQAAQFFESAILLSPGEPDPYFEIGEMLLADGVWSDAADYFEMANTRNFRRPQLLHYYRGVAEFNAGKRIPAFQHFRYVLWSPTNPDLSASAREYIGRIRTASLLDIRFGTGAFYDSNIFRLAPGEDAPHGLKHKSDRGYRTNFGLSLIAFEVGRGTWFFSYDIERRVLSTLELAQLSITRQTVASNFGYKVGGDSADDAIYEIGIKPNVQMFSLGDKRSMDSIGLDFYLLFSNLWSQPSLHYESARRIDPYPQRDDVLDPILWEVTAANDRSNQYGAMALYMRPFSNETWTVDLGIKSGVTTYRDAAVHADSNTDSDFRLSLEYNLNIRNKFSTAINYKTRSFYDAEDERADKAIVNDATWRFYYTPNFSHTLMAGYENGGSSRKAAKFSRSIADFGVELAF